MFHRAAATAVSQPKQPDANAIPFRFSQAASISKTLSPQSSFTINSRIMQTAANNRLSTQTTKKHILLQQSTPKVNTPENLSEHTNHDVYFNEDDFDDDIDFNFDAKAESGCTELNSSQAVSWPPSSYIQKTEESVQPIVKIEASVATNTVTTSRSFTKSEGSLPSSSPVAVPKRPRRLPWSCDKKDLKVIGQQNLKARSASTCSALREAEVEEDFEIVAPPRMDPLKFNERNLKVAIKEAKGKKRALENPSSTKLRLGTQTHAKSVAQVFLSKEQREVIELIKQGKSVFFTGSAGTGKSVLLREAIKELKHKYNNSEAVGITASTGLAACNIGGITLHSFAGVGLGKEGVVDLVKKIKKAKKNLIRWTKTKVLIIDEISMVDADFYDKLEAVARKIRANDKPWGGIQIVATGDFFQLPPVPDKGKVARFSFEADKWKALDHTIQLTTVFRQRDEGFVMMLNQMRTGELSARTINAFKALSRAPNYEDGFEPTELFPTRTEVDTANSMRMRAIPGVSQTYVAEDSGSFQGDYREKLLANCMASKQLTLKKGAQVMLIKNRDELLVNGSLGVVVGFMSERLYTFALDEEDGSFDENMLRDSPWTDEELAACDRSPSGKRKMIKLMNMQQTSASSKIWPVVRFKVPGGRTDIHQLMSPESWKFETPTGEIQACRKQVPLILAYAISIHKAQGQTIERVKVDLGKVFEKGQAYVALSRAVSQEGLQVLRFDAKKVMAHPKVAAFYRELSEVSKIGKEEIGAKKRTSTIARVDSFDLTTPMTTQDVFEQIKREPSKAFPLYRTRG